MDDILYISHIVKWAREHVGCVKTYFMCSFPVVVVRLIAYWIRHLAPEVLLILSGLAGLFVVVLFRLVSWMGAFIIVALLTILTVAPLLYFIMKMIVQGIYHGAVRLSQGLRDLMHRPYKHLHLS